MYFSRNMVKQKKYIYILLCCNFSFQTVEVSNYHLCNKIFDTQLYGHIEPDREIVSLTTVCYL